MPPPPSIGSARPPTEAPENASNDGPSDDVGSRSLPVGGVRPRVPTPPPVSPSASATGLRAPSLDASASATGLKVPSLGPPTGVGAASDSAGSWPRTDGWDLVDDGGSAGAGSGSVPSVPKSGATGSIPSIPKLGSIPSIPKPAATKPGATKEVGSVPSVPKLGAAKDVGSVPSVPKLGAPPKVGPLPKPGAARPAPAARRRASEDADARPLFGASLAADGSLLPEATSGSGGAPSEASAEPLDPLAAFDTPSLDVAGIDASAPPSSASPLDALPSFDADAPPDGVPQDGVPAMDSAALFDVALEPVAAFEPGPRLPVPGMLRDGAALPAADFRATPRTPRSQPAAAMPPPRGMVPPKPRDDEEAPRLKPGDTQAFVAQVAEELMEEVERQRAEQAAAALEPEPPAEPEAEAAKPVAASVAAPAAPRAAAPSIVPIGPSNRSAREAETKRRGMILGVGAIGLAAAIGLFVWLSGDRDEPPTQTAAATNPPALDAATPTAPAADDGAAKAEPPAPLPPPDAADAADSAAGEAVAADPAAADPAGDPSELAAESAGDAGAAAPDAEPAPDEAPQPGGSSRKSSGKGSKSSGKAGGGGSAKEEPAPAPKPDDAPSAAKLLKQARSAYNAGKGSTAYSLASKSNRMEPSGEAAEVMALAACQMGDADKAKAALRTVPLFNRGPVRSTCKSKHGVKLGL